MKASEVLESAANIILRDGWNQNAYFLNPDISTLTPDQCGAAVDEANQSAPCCQEGAICRAGTGWAFYGGKATTYDQRLAVRRATSWMERYVYANYQQRSPIAWNDLPSTTKEEVVAALRGAAEMARAAGE